MQDIVAIIDKIIEEHKILLAQAVQLESITNDASAMMAMAKSKEVFVPGRYNQINTLNIFENLRIKTQEGLFAHFNREETSLLDAILEFGNQNFINSLKKLLAEHNNFKVNLESLKNETDELINGELSRAMWETKAYDLRAHISEMHRMLHQHAQNEQNLLNDIRKEVIELLK
jgi:hypothetical protein